MCPDLTLVQVPTAHGKSDMQLYREAGSEVAAVLAETSGAQAMEKASVDEVYIDITEAASQKLKYSSLEEIIREAAGTHMAGGVEGGQQMPGPDGSSKFAHLSALPQLFWNSICRHWSNKLQARGKAAGVEFCFQGEGASSPGTAEDLHLDPLAFDSMDRTDRQSADFPAVT